jgi:hypothetical protein
MQRYEHQTEFELISGCSSFAKEPLTKKEEE